MIVIIVPLLIAVIGFIIMLVSNHPDVKEFGKAMLWVGIFFTVWIVSAGKMFQLP